MDHMGFQMHGMAPPPLMNQPPQIFGGYSTDGLPNVSQMPPDLAAHMFPDAHLLMEDTNEAKRRRIARVRHSAFLDSEEDPLLMRRVVKRHATCVGRRRSNVTASYPHAHTV